ncbi:1-acyl-sn-glycerol-3-phosphate acyltransferase [Corynebacterium bovis]|nr:1-acyl-sn-glycerol-3-phosphate acyltransferase [Corynebacterium bovis]
MTSLRGASNPHPRRVRVPRAARVLYGETMIRRLVARVFWRCSRWTLSTRPAPDGACVLVGAPHTSNWDFILMLAIAWRLDIHVHWMGKDSLFRGWMRPLMLALGGIPVDRDNPGGLIDDVLGRIRTDDHFALVITPDGTRSGHSRWKSGFYRIAREADLPVILGYVDRTTMTTGLGPTLRLTGDVAADMDRIRDFYSDKAGFTPAHRVEPRLREE